MREINRNTSNKYLLSSKQKFFQYYGHIIGEKLHEKLKNFDIDKYYNKVYSRKSNKTLIHGDTHINNMLFGDDVDVIFVDWQIINYEIGTRDLIYFLVFSCNEDLVSQNFWDFKKFYYQTLLKNSNESSSLFNYSWELFEEDILDSIYYIAYCVIVISCTSDPNSKDVNDIKVNRARDLCIKCVKSFVNLTNLVGIDRILN